MEKSFLYTSTRRLLRKLPTLKRSIYERSLVDRGWYDLSVRSSDDPIIIGGCGRSGTTLLREILNRHPRIFCGPETSMFGLPFWPQHIAPYWQLNEIELQRDVERSPNLVKFAETFYRRHAKEAGKIRWADKTPNNIRAIEKILTWFPQARFIHVLRDGRDVVCSLRHHPKEKFVNGNLVPIVSNNPIPFCTTRWLRDTMKGLAFRGHPRYLEVKYEDLVVNPGSEIRRVCEFVGEDFSPGMLDTNSGAGKSMKSGRLINNPNAAKRITPKSVGRWTNDLSFEERQHFINVAGELLIVTGYENNHDWLKNE